MVGSRGKLQQFGLQCIIPILCSMVVGFIFSGVNVFDPHYGAFQFVWSGVVASVFYYLLASVSLRDALLGFLLLFLLTFITTGSSQPAFIMRDILYIAGIGASVFVYFKYFRQALGLAYAYPPFMLAGIYAIFNIITLEFNSWIIRNFVIENAGGGFVGLASTGAHFGALIGFAVGGGIAINEKLPGNEKNTASVPVVSETIEQYEENSGDAR